MAVNEPDLAAIRSKVTDFLKGLMLGEPDLLSSAADMAGIQQRFARVAPGIDVLSTATFRNLLCEVGKGYRVRYASMSRDEFARHIERLCANLDVRGRDGVAWCSDPFEGPRIHLERRAGGWTVIRFEALEPEPEEDVPTAPQSPPSPPRPRDRARGG
ncbi:MAG: hypothetical protein L0216_06105 [Planctomycetales bacterium]|nr:hypothetical protein [Planctomycetales bacterium]